MFKLLLKDTGRGLLRLTVWKEHAVNWAEDASESGKETRDREISEEVMIVNLGKH